MTAISQRMFYPCALVFLDWPGDPVYAHTGVGTISWAGETWQGVGSLGSISVPEEAQGLLANRAVLRLKTSLVGAADALEAPIRNHPGQIFAAATLTRGGTGLIGSPVETFSGFLDSGRVTYDRKDNGELITELIVELTSGPRARARASINHSDEDQRFYFPGDTAGRFLNRNRANTMKLRWPSN